MTECNTTGSHLPMEETLCVMPWFTKPTRKRLQQEVYRA
jgi:hypothetical protein